MDTDGSQSGIGAVLSQVQDGQERVISYASKSLGKSQQRYCATFLELVAVVTFVKHFRHYLWGRHFLIRTDHASLVWLKNFKEPEGMLARWLTVLETYDYSIQYRKGSLHSNADAMSRIPVRKRKCKRESCLDCSNSLQVKGSDMPNSKIVDKIHTLPVVHSCVDSIGSDFTSRCNIIQPETRGSNSDEDRQSSSVVHPA